MSEKAGISTDLWFRHLKEDVGNVGIPTLPMSSFILNTITIMLQTGFFENNVCLFVYQ